MRMWDNCNFYILLVGVNGTSFFENQLAFWHFLIQLNACLP